MLIDPSCVLPKDAMRNNLFLAQTPLRYLTASALFNVGDGGPVIFKYDLMGHK